MPVTQTRVLSTSCVVLLSLQRLYFKLLAARLRPEPGGILFPQRMALLVPLKVVLTKSLG